MYNSLGAGTKAIDSLVCGLQRETIVYHFNKDLSETFTVSPPTFPLRHREGTFFFEAVQNSHPSRRRVLCKIHSTRLVRGALAKPDRTRIVIHSIESSTILDKLKFVCHLAANWQMSDNKSASWGREEREDRQARTRFREHSDNFFSKKGRRCCSQLKFEVHFGWFVVFSLNFSPLNFVDVGKKENQQTFTIFY